MHAAALRVELLLRDVQSLKQKRSRLKSVTHQLTKRYPVAVAEIDHQDLWKRSTLGIAAVAAQAGQLDRLLHSVVRWLDGLADVEVLETGTAHLVED
jgi:uncharacterized protein YlxP (DUF503 family)